MLPTFKKAQSLIFFLFLLIPQSSSADLNDDNLFPNTTAYQKIKVGRVLSADTIELENGERIRLIGLKAPKPPKKEKVKKDEFGFVIEDVDPWTTLDEEAFIFARRLLEGQYVRLEFDTERRNERASLAYVFLIKDDLFANTEILRQGFADLQITPPNLKYADKLREAYREAKKEQRGLQAQ